MVPYARQVRLSGPINLELGSGLARLEERLVSVELRDQDGTPFQRSLARVAWAELSSGVTPELVVELDACLSVAPLEEDREAQKERLEKAFARAREYEPAPPGTRKVGRRLPREQLLARNRLLLSDIQGGMTQVEAAARHGIAPQTVSKIVRRARDASQD